jgi:cell division protein ZapA
MKRSFSVTIAGQRYTIKSDAEESYVHTLAELVDDRIKQVQRGAKTAAPAAVAVLAALQIADDLVRERNGRAELRRRVREKSRAIRALLDRKIAVDDRKVAADDREAGA